MNAAAVAVQEPPAEADPVEIERTCRRCGEVKPLGLFVAARNCRFGRAFTCLACDAATRKAKQAGRDGRPGWSVEANRQIEAVGTDPRVSELVHRVLAVHQANGLPFDQAWPDAYRTALRTVTGQQRVNWRAALEWSKPAWRASYEGEKWPEPFRPITINPEALAA